MKHEALPLYVQIADQLRQNIRQGVYQIEDKLPSENELSDRFGVNRHTLRRAVSLLKNEGILRVDKGRGIFVTADPISYPIGKRVRFNEALQTQGRKASYQLLRTLEISADSAIAQKLELRLGESVAAIEMLGLADERPLSITTSYFPLQQFPDIVQQFKNLQSVSRLLREVYGCDHIRRQTDVSARIVKPSDARLLKIALNRPILLVKSINKDQSDRVVEYGVTRFRGDDMKLVFTNEDKD